MVLIRQDYKCTVYLMKYPILGGLCFVILLLVLINSCKILSHRPLGEGEIILKVKLANPLYRISSLGSCYEIAIRWMSQSLTNQKSTWVQVMVRQSITWSTNHRSPLISMEHNHSMDKLNFQQFALSIRNYDLMPAKWSNLIQQLHQLPQCNVAALIRCDGNVLQSLEDTAACLPAREGISLQLHELQLWKINFLNGNFENFLGNSNKLLVIDSIVQDCGTSIAYVLE